MSANESPKLIIEFKRLHGDASTAKYVFGDDGAMKSM